MYFIFRTFQTHLKHIINSYFGIKYIRTPIFYESCYFTGVAEELPSQEGLKKKKKSQKLRKRWQLILKEIDSAIEALHDNCVSSDGDLDQVNYSLLQLEQYSYIFHILAKNSYVSNRK